MNSSKEHWRQLAAVNCVANVDSASGVVYGSQGTQFVTMVLKAGTEHQPP